MNPDRTHYEPTGDLEGPFKRWQAQAKPDSKSASQLVAEVPRIVLTYSVGWLLNAKETDVTLDKVLALPPDV